MPLVVVVVVVIASTCCRHARSLSVAQLDALPLHRQAGHTHTHTHRESE